MDQISEKPQYVIGYISSPHPHADLHLKTLDLIPEVKGVRFCGIDGQEPRRFATETPKVISTTDGLDDLLEQSDIDALVVCVRNDLCPAILDAALNVGIPTLFEKPGAVNASDLNRIAEIAQATDVTFGAMYQKRGDPIVKEAREVIEKGALGTVIAAEARIVTSQVRFRDPDHWLFSKETAGSGILSWLGCHYIDLLCFLMDDKISEVTAIVGKQNPEPIEVEDTACLVFRFEGGAIGSLTAGYHLSNSPLGYSGASYDTFLALRGTDGHLTMPLPNGRSGYCLLSSAPGWPSGSNGERLFHPLETPAYGGKAGEEFVLDFLMAARNRTPAPAPIEAAVHVLNVIEAAIESSAFGRLVKVVNK